MKIFLTGGSGFVGGAFARALARTHEIVALSRSPQSDAALMRLGALPVRGDLETVSAEMLAGAGAVVHAAAFVEEWGPLRDYERVNVEGTQRLLAAAREARARRFVHVGTEAALFHGQPMRDIDETYPLAPNSPFPYSRTKARAEMAVRAANDPAGGFETIVIRPRLIWGPGDKTVLPVVKAMAEAGKFVWIDGGRAMTSTTHIDNLVAALELALTKGRPGEAYFVVDGPPMRFRDFLTRYLKTAGVDLPDKSAPGWLARGLANLVEPIYRLAGSKTPPPVTRFTAHIMSRDCTINDAKARAELGYRPAVAVEEGLARLAA
ncbi:MAG: NAD-dependent epimerase/dehydratase family protein [Alphaproteobacteria bacterium]|nr:NAD-dependent epimerase/dehydratase family protein [Alphaproteobacteria bacterium]